MYRVLLVDDEPLVLEGLRSMIDWEESGFTVIGEAFDGEDALALLEQCTPDVVITDIRMPITDGLELIRQARTDRDLPVKFIILSSYDEFQYATTAMRYEVRHYLLKPMDEKEIEQALKEVKEELDQERITQAEEKLVLQQILANMLHGNYSKEYLRQASSMLDSGKGLVFRYILMEWQPPSLLHLQSEPEDRKNREMLHMIWKANFTDESLAFYLFDEPHQQIGALLIGEWCGAPTLNDVLQRAANDFQAKSSCPVSFFVSGETDQMEQLPDLYTKVLSMRRETITLGTGEVYFPNSTKGRGHSDLFDEAAALIKAVTAGNPAALVADLQRIVARVRQEEPAAFVAQAFLSHMKLELRKRLLDWKTDDAPLPPVFLLSQEWPRPSLAAFKQQLEELCGQAALDLGRPKGSGNVIQEAVAYMEDHYHEKLQLQDVAEMLHLNPVYFGQLFKKQTGMLFGDYLHRLRMKTAKKLLRSTDLKIAEIACRVGYSDADHFVRKFKSIVQCLPSVYKNSDLQGAGDSL